MGTSIFAVMRCGLKTTIVKTLWTNRPILSGGLRCFSSGVKNIRNVGIMAHVDAGKTSTSELMLFNCNYMLHPGTVDSGSTVMDFMELEQQRGITISSASITMLWERHNVDHPLNYIDTPGHVDFTMEVESALSVMDGGIVVLDGSAGVEAQTMTVWRQADKYTVPRIAFINKLDKESASLEGCVKSMESRLGVKPLVTQTQIGEGSNFKGVLNLVTMEAYLWNRRDGSKGKNIEVVPEENVRNSMFETYEAGLQLREALVEEVSNFDDKLAEMVIERDSYEADVTSLQEALRRVTLQSPPKALVTLLGSAKEGIGIQPLINAIVDYLPSPKDRPCSEAAKYGSSFSAKVFKVMHDPNKGSLCFVRIYSGKLTNKEKTLYNVNQGKKEKVGKLMVAFANDMKDVEEVDMGNFAVISGLKETVTGDTLVISASEAKGTLPGPSVPNPVVSCTMEPPSLSQESQFNRGLAALAREDPSMQIKRDDESGRTVVGAMGELHLDIVKTRMLKEYKVEVEVNKVNISYCEQACQPARLKEEVRSEMGGKEQLVQLDVEVLLTEHGETGGVKVANTREAQASFSKLWQQESRLRLIQEGLQEGLERGPILEAPVHGCYLVLHSAFIQRGTNEAFIKSAASKIAKLLLSQADVRLTEPIMSVEILTDPDLAIEVRHSLFNRRGEVVEEEMVGTQLNIRGRAPMAELIGYSAYLRRELSGQAEPSIEKFGYQLMSKEEQDAAIEEVTGFSPQN